MAGVNSVWVVRPDSTAAYRRVVLGDTYGTMWCVDEGLASCWVHVDGRPRRKDDPEGERAADYLRTFLPIPEGCEPLCAVALGYSDFRPAPLPAADDEARILRLG